MASSKGSKAPNLLSSAELAALDLPGQVLTIRGQRVLVAQQLAALYAVEPRVLMQQVQRNIERFPPDFMFQLTEPEFASLKSRFVTSSWGGLRKLPYAFTEQGVAMLSGVLRSERAVAVNIEIMRAFVAMRGMVSRHADLQRRLVALEKKYDEGFRGVFAAIEQLMDEPAPGAYSKRRIGFTKEK